MSNFWDCKHGDYDESWDGEEDLCYYVCDKGFNDCPDRCDNCEYYEE